MCFQDRSSVALRFDCCVKHLLPSHTPSGDKLLDPTNRTNYFFVHSMYFYYIFKQICKKFEQAFTLDGSELHLHSVDSHCIYKKKQNGL